MRCCSAGATPTRKSVSIRRSRKHNKMLYAFSRSDLHSVDGIGILHDWRAIVDVQTTNDLVQDDREKMAPPRDSLFRRWHRPPILLRRLCVHPDLRRPRLIPSVQK